MSTSLCAHNGTSIATREQVLAVATPAPRSRTHRVVPHAEVIAEILEELGRRCLAVTNEAYSLSPDGNRLFGVLDTRDDVMPSGMGVAIGIRNSHDQTLALGVCAGTRVFVCDNLAFCGEVIRYRKHTRRISAPEVIRGAIDHILESTHREARWLENLKARELDDQTAKSLLIDGLRSGACTAQQLREVVALYFQAGTDSASLYATRTAWSLYGCFTESYKGQALGLTLARSRSLNRVFGQLVCRN